MRKVQSILVLLLPSAKNTFLMRGSHGKDFYEDFATEVQECLQVLAEWSLAVFVIIVDIGSMEWKVFD